MECTLLLVSLMITCVSGILNTASPIQNSQVDSQIPSPFTESPVEEDKLEKRILPPAIYRQLQNLSKMKQRTTNSYDSYDYEELDRDFSYQDNNKTDYTYYDLNNYGHLKEKRFPMHVVDVNEMNFLAKLYSYVNKVPYNRDLSFNQMNWRPPSNTYRSYYTPYGEKTNFRKNPLGLRQQSMGYDYSNIPSNQKLKKWHKLPLQQFQNQRNKFDSEPVGDQYSSFTTKNYQAFQSNENDFKDLSNGIKNYLSALQINNNDSIKVEVVMENNVPKLDNEIENISDNIKRSFYEVGEDAPILSKSEDEKDIQNTNVQLTISLRKLMLNQIYLLSESLETLKELEQNINTDNITERVSFSDNEVMKNYREEMRNRTKREKRAVGYDGHQVLQQVLELEDSETILLLLEDLLFDVHTELTKLVTNVSPIPVLLKHNPKNDQEIKIEKLKSIVRAIHVANKTVLNSNNIHVELENIRKLLEKIQVSKFISKSKKIRKRRSATESKEQMDIVKHPISLKQIQIKDKEQFQTDIERLNLGNLLTGSSPRVFAYPNINLVHKSNSEEQTTEDENTINAENVLSEAALRQRMLDLNKGFKQNSGGKSKETWINLINRGSKSNRLTREIFQIVNSGIANSKDNLSTFNVLYEDQDVLISEIPKNIIQSSSIEDLKSLIKNNGTFVSEIYIIKDGSCHILKKFKNAFLEETCGFTEDKLDHINKKHLNIQSKEKSLDSQIPNSLQKVQNFATRMDNPWRTTSNKGGMNKILTNPLYQKQSHQKPIFSTHNFRPSLDSIRITNPPNLLKMPNIRLGSFSTAGNVSDQNSSPSDLSNLLSQNDLANLFFNLESQREDHNNRGKDHHSSNGKSKEQELLSSLLAGIDLLSNVESVIEKLEHQQNVAIKLPNITVTDDNRLLRNLSSILPFLNGIQFDTEKQINVELTLDNNKKGFGIASQTSFPSQGNRMKQTNSIRLLGENMFGKSGIKNKILQDLSQVFPNGNMLVIPANFFSNIDFSDYGSNLTNRRDTLKNIDIPTLLNIIDNAENGNLTIAQIIKENNVLLKKSGEAEPDGELQDGEEQDEEVRAKKEISELIKSDEFIDTVVSTFFGPLTTRSLNENKVTPSDVIKQINITKSNNSREEDNLEIFILRYNGDTGLHNILTKYKNATSDLVYKDRTKNVLADDDDKRYYAGRELDIPINSKKLKNDTNVRVTISIHNNQDEYKKKPSSLNNVFHKVIQLPKTKIRSHNFRSQRPTNNVAFNYDRFRRNPNLFSKFPKAKRLFSGKNQAFRTYKRNRKFSSRMQKLNMNDNSLSQQMPQIPEGNLIPHLQFPAILPLEIGTEKPLILLQRETEPQWLWVGKDGSRSNRKRNSEDSIELGQKRLNTIMNELNDFFDKSGLPRAKETQDERWLWK